MERGILQAGLCGEFDRKIERGGNAGRANQT